MEAVILILVLVFIGFILYTAELVAKFFRILQITYKSSIYKKSKNFLEKHTLENILSIVKDIIKNNIENIENSYLIKEIQQIYNLESFQDYSHKFININEKLGIASVVIFLKQRMDFPFLLSFKRENSEWKLEKISIANQKNLKTIKGFNRTISSFDKLKLFLVDNLYLISYLVINIIIFLGILFFHHLGIIYKLQFLLYYFLSASLSNLLTLNYFLQLKDLKYEYKSESEKSKNAFGYIFWLLLLFNLCIFGVAVIQLLDEERDAFYIFNEEEVYDLHDTLPKISYDTLEKKLLDYNNKIENLRIYSGQYKPKKSKRTKLYYNKKVYPFSGIYISFKDKKPTLFEIYEKGIFIYSIKVIDYSHYIKTNYYDNKKSIEQISEVSLEYDIRVEGDTGIRKKAVAREKIKIYDINGNLVQESQCFNKKVIGKSKFYDEKGNLIPKNKKNAWVRHYFKTGYSGKSVKESYNQKMKYYSEFFEEYLKTNKVKTVMKDKKIYTGKKIEYYPNDSIRKEEYFKDGEGYTRRYYKNGKIEAEGYFLKKGFSAWKFYTKRDYVDYWGVYKNGIKYDGTFIKRDENEKWSVKESYYLGEGKVKYFHNGKIYFKGRI